MDYWDLTAKQLHFRVFGKCGIEDRTLCEISGPTGSGKSLVMQKIMAHCLAPYKYGGLQWSIRFISLSHKIDTESLEKAVRAELRDWNGEPAPSEAEIAEIAKESVSKVTFVNCFATQDVFNAFKNTILSKAHNLIAVDTLSEFYWLDFPTRQKKNERLSMYRYYKQWQTRLGQICADNNVCGMYTVLCKFLENKYRDTPLTFKVNYSLKLTKTRRKRTLNGKPISFKDNVM